LSLEPNPLPFVCQCTPQRRPRQSRQQRLEAYSRNLRALLQGLVAVFPSSASPAHANQQPLRSPLGIRNNKLSTGSHRSRPVLTGDSSRVGMRTYRQGDSNRSKRVSWITLYSERSHICVEANTDTRWRSFSSRGESGAMLPDDSVQKCGPNICWLRVIGPQQIAARRGAPTDRCSLDVTSRESREERR